MTTRNEKVVAMTADQRRASVAALERLSAADWKQPSLCDGWNIHQLAAHLTLPYTSKVSRILKQVVLARGSFDRAADAMARADAEEYSPERLVEIMAENVDHPWKPPGGGPAGALSHDVIHSWDFTTALGLRTVVTPERARVVLEAFKPSHLKGFGVDLTATRFEATDDFTAIGPSEHEAATVVRAPLLELIPLATGRVA